MKFCSVQGCKFPNFSVDKVTKLPYCRMHQTRRTDYDRRTIIQKAIAKQGRLEGKIRSLAAPVDNSLTLWFKLKMNTSKKICENCGADLSHYNEKDWQGSQHHVLEKSIFRSVSVHPDNHLVLGKWCCHSQWHSSMLNASKMPIFKKAEKIVHKLFHLLNEEEKRKISNYYEIN